MKTEEIKERLFKTKMIELPDNGGSVFRTDEVMRAINAYEELFAESLPPLEDKKKQLNKQFEIHKGVVIFDARDFWDKIYQPTLPQKNFLIPAWALDFADKYADYRKSPPINDKPREAVELKDITDEDAIVLCQITNNMAASVHGNINNGHLICDFLLGKRYDIGTDTTLSGPETITAYKYLESKGYKIETGWEKQTNKCYCFKNGIQEFCDNSCK